MRIFAAAIVAAVIALVVFGPQLDHKWVALGLLLTTIATFVLVRKSGTLRLRRFRSRDIDERWNRRFIWIGLGLIVAAVAWFVTSVLIFLGPRSPLPPSESASVVIVPSMALLASGLSFVAYRIISRFLE